MRKSRYNSINGHLKRLFGQRVYKVTLESGCSCPNRDGTIGNTGCIFCNEAGYNPAANRDGKNFHTIKEQLYNGIDYVRKRHNVTKFISYFQSGSNTYGPLKSLSDKYNEALDHPDVVGLAISTRPDCISKEMVSVFEKLSKETMLWIELGLQSSNSKTLKNINRGHNEKIFKNITKTLQARGINVCAHVIIGLPKESKREILETAHFLNELRIWGVKIHNLHILKDTQLERMYDEGKIKIYSLDEYSNMAVDFLENLKPEILIHRVNSHSPRELTIAPNWSINKLAIFNAIEKELERRNSWQGKLFSQTCPSFFNQ